MKFSLISPTFGRPEEVQEFLASLYRQEHKDFEVILADGTPGNALEPEIRELLDRAPYPVTFLHQDRLPVSDARNLAARQAKGEWLIFFDSDCLIPKEYLRLIEPELDHRDAFGGPDGAHPSFSTLQKAISFSMTSLFTTGGIRGKKAHVGDFLPRGFNMGIRRETFFEVNGYDEGLKCAEDIDLSLRIRKAGKRVGLLPQALVFHKRRTTLKKFYKQVYRFGAARINLWQRHPEQLKVTHLFPLVWSLGLLLSILLFPFSPILYSLYLLYFLAIFLAATWESKDVAVGFLSILTSAVMLLGYGYGFFRNLVAVKLFGRKEGIPL